jgi:predicted TIM-barrel fold metal-dependent hydrolase
MFRLRILAAVVICLLGDLTGLQNACAQSVDVEQSLTEDRALQRPLLSIQPWRWTRKKLLDTTASIKDLTRLSLGLSYTTIYQIAPNAPTPHHTWVGSLDVYGAWHLVDSATLGEGTLGFVFRDRNVWAPLTGNQLAADVGLPWGVNNSGSAGYNRFNQVWWQQSLLDEKLVIQAAKIDQTTHFNTNRVASSDGRDFLMQSLVYRMYRPLWRALEELNLTASIHPSTGHTNPEWTSVGAFVERVSAKLEIGHSVAEAVAYDGDNAIALTALMFCGHTEDYPELKLAFVHGGTPMLWLALEKAETYLSFYMFDDVTLESAELFASRPYLVTFYPWDTSFISRNDMFQQMGCWGSRYPHHDASAPQETVTKLEQAGVSDAVIAALMGANAARVYGIAL